MKIFLVFIFPKIYVVVILIKRIKIIKHTEKYQILLGMKQKKFKEIRNLRTEHTHR